MAIFDLNLDLIEKSRPAAKPVWTPNQPLKRNVVYIWQVTAVKDGREIAAPASPAREARFKILSSDRAAAFARVSSQFADSHLKLGMIIVFLAGSHYLCYKAHDSVNTAVDTRA